MGLRGALLKAGSARRRSQLLKPGSLAPGPTLPASTRTLLLKKGDLKRAAHSYPVSLYLVVFRTPLCAGEPHTAAPFLFIRWFSVPHSPLCAGELHTAAPFLFIRWFSVPHTPLCPGEPHTVTPFLCIRWFSIPHSVLESRTQLPRFSLFGGFPYPTLHSVLESW